MTPGGSFRVASSSQRFASIIKTMKIALSTPTLCIAVEPERPPHYHQRGGLGTNLTRNKSIDYS
jgi:hypothetical protein